MFYTFPKDDPGKLCIVITFYAIIILQCRSQGWKTNETRPQAGRKFQRIQKFLKYSLKILKYETTCPGHTISFKVSLNLRNLKTTAISLFMLTYPTTQRVRYVILLIADSTPLFPSCHWGCTRVINKFCHFQLIQLL